MAISARMDSVYVLLVGTVLGRAAEFIFMLPFARKKGYEFRPILDLKDDNLRALFYLALPVIIGSSIDQINVLIDRTLASRIAIGGISALSYANRLKGFINGLFVMSVSNIMYPMISTMASEKNMRGLKETLHEAIGMISLVVVPATIGAILFAEPIVAFLFGRGAFTREAVALTSSALRYYSIGMLGFGLREVLSRAFFALQDTRTPMINGMIAVGINIVLNVILSRYLGIGGLALATSIAGIVATGLLVVALRKKIGAFGLRKVATSLGKIVVSCVVMGVITLPTYRYLSDALASSLALVLTIGVGVFSYFVSAYFLAVPEVRRTIEAVRRWFSARKSKDGLAGD